MARCVQRRGVNPWLLGDIRPAKSGVLKEGYLNNLRGLVMPTNLLVRRQGLGRRKTEEIIQRYGDAQASHYATVMFNAVMRIRLVPR